MLAAVMSANMFRGIDFKAAVLYRADIVIFPKICFDRSVATLEQQLSSLFAKGIYRRLIV